MEVMCFSQTTNQSLDSDTNHAELEPSTFENDATTSNLSGEDANLPNKPIRRFIYTSLSSSSSSESSESEYSISSSESDISDFDFLNLNAESLSSSIMRKFRPESKAAKLEQSIIEDVSILSVRAAHLSNKSNLRPFYSSLLSSSSNSKSSESECSNVSYDGDVSDFHSQSVDFEPVTSSGYAISTKNCKQNTPDMEFVISSNYPFSKKTSELSKAELESIIPSNYPFSKKTSELSKVELESIIPSNYAFSEKCKQNTAGLVPKNIDITEATPIVLDRDVYSPYESHCRFWQAALQSSSSSTSESSSESEIDINEPTLSELTDKFRKTFNLYKAKEKFTNTHNWVQSFNLLDVEDDEPMGACGNAINTEQEELDFDLERFWASRRHYKKYWNVDDVILDSNSDKPKEEDRSERVSKVTFAPDDSLVTVHTFEREPEELLPDTYELDRIRFQMRINSFSVLMVPFLSVEHRIQIMQRNGIN